MNHTDLPAQVCVLQVGPQLCDGAACTAGG